MGDLTDAESTHAEAESARLAEEVKELEDIADRDGFEAVSALLKYRF